MPVRQGERVVRAVRKGGGGGVWVGRFCGDGTLGVEEEGEVGIGDEVTGLWGGSLLLMADGAPGVSWPAGCESGISGAAMGWGCGCSENDEEAVVFSYSDAVVSCRGGESSLAARLLDVLTGRLMLRAGIFLTKVRPGAAEHSPERSAAPDRASARGAALWLTEPSAVRGG